MDIFITDQNMNSEESKVAFCIMVHRCEARRREWEGIGGEGRGWGVNRVG